MEFIKSKIVESLSEPIAPTVRDMIKTLQTLTYEYDDLIHERIENGVYIGEARREAIKSRLLEIDAAKTSILDLEVRL